MPPNPPPNEAAAALPVRHGAQTRKFLLTTAIAGFLVGMVALGLAWRQGLFESQWTYPFATSSGDNLSRGMAVQFRGFKIGYLGELELLADGSISGQVVIKQKYAVFITQGASLRLSKDKIVTSELVLVPGAPGAPALTNGSPLSLRTDGGMDALEKRILDRVDPVLAELTALMQRLGDPQHGVPSAVEALRVSLVQANTTLQQVNATLVTANKTFGDIDGRIKDPKIDGILANAEQTLAGLKTNTDALNKTLQSSQQLMGAGQQTLQGTNAELAKTLAATQRVLNETVNLMQDMRGSTLGRFLVGPRHPASAANPADTTGTLP